MRHVVNLVRIGGSLYEGVLAAPKRNGMPRAEDVQRNLIHSEVILLCLAGPARINQ